MGVRRLRIRAVGLAAGAALSLLGYMPTLAADSLDQSQTTADRTNNSRTPMAQTFKPAVSGDLDRVSLMLAPGQTGTTVSVEIQDVSGGQPDGVVLGSSVSAAVVACCNQWQAFTFDAGLTLAAGSTYAIVARPVGFLAWYDSYNSDTYPAGQLWIQSGGVWQYNTNLGKDFVFQTWMVPSTAANQPPVIAPATASVSAPEGSTVSETGTYSDPENDTVALTATEGTLSRTGTSSGTWSWSMYGADEMPPHAVTVTADDGHGNTATASFSAGFTAVLPTVAITGAPASGPEGTPITLSGKATSVSPADNAAGFTYTWTVTKDGSSFATGSGPTLTFTPDDEGTFVAALQAADQGGNVGSSSVTVNGLNVAPAVAITGATHEGILLLPVQPVTFAGGFTDPGVADTHTATLNWGDGSPEDAYSFAAGVSGQTTESHGYAAPGTYKITYTVSDDDGGTTTASASVTVGDALVSLRQIYAYVQALSLDKGRKNELLHTLQDAINAATKKDNHRVCERVDDALHQVIDLAKGPQKLSATDEATLADALWSVHRSLGCRKVKMGWLKLSL